LDKKRADVSCRKAPEFEARASRIKILGRKKAHASDFRTGQCWGLKKQKKKRPTKAREFLGRLLPFDRGKGWGRTGKRKA